MTRAEAEPTDNSPVAPVRRNGSRPKPSDDLAVLRLEDVVELAGLPRASGVWS